MKGAERAKRERLGTLLKAARVSAGLTQRALAKRMPKRAHSFVAKIEQGQRRLYVEEFFEYARAVQVDPVEFMDTLSKELR